MKNVMIVYLVAMMLIMPNIIIAQEAAQEDMQFDLMKVHYKAESDAKADLVVGKAGWGLGAFGASLLASPLLGGGLTILAAYNTGGTVIVPLERSAELKKMYPENLDALHAYENKYLETYTALKKKGQGKAAWVGTGAGFVVNLFLVASMLADAE